MDANKRVIVFRTGIFGTWREKLNGISAFAKSAGWTITPVDARTSRPDFAQLVNYWKPAGFILEASGIPEMFDGLETIDNTPPAVVMNPASAIRSGIRHSVTSDSRLIAKIAMSELLSSNPASLLFIEWFHPSFAWSCEKRNVFKTIAGMHGLPHEVCTPEPEDAANPAMLEKRIASAMSKMQRPCGVFAVTDMIGAAAVSAAASIGAEVPSVFSVVSVDDDPETCETCSPTLSSVRPDFNRLGFSAASLLADLIANPGLPEIRKEIPPVGIVRRGSSVHTRVYDKTVYAALEKIRLHACEGITPSEIAKSFDVSRRMAEIRFKAATGHTIGDEILERRLAAACDYLMRGVSSIPAIADFCGWNSDIAFRKAFRSRFGVSPLQWREQVKIGAGAPKY